MFKTFKVELEYLFKGQKDTAIFTLRMAENTGESIIVDEATKLFLAIYKKATLLGARML